MATAIVSPSALANPKTAAPIIPDRTQGRLTFLTTSQSFIPSASAPSFGSPADRAEQVTSSCRHDGHDHYGEHHARSKKAFAVTDVPTKEIKHRDVGHVVSDKRRYVVCQERAECDYSPKAEHHARHACDHLEEQPSSIRNVRGSFSTTARAVPTDTGTAKINAIAEVSRVPATRGSAP